MATASAKSKSTEAEKAEDEKPQEKDDTFSVEFILANSFELAGVPTHVAVGALHDSDRKNFTVVEFKKLVEKWEGSEVQ